MSKLQAFRECQRGTTAVEFAAVVGPLLMLMFAVMEYGQLFWAQEGLQETAIAGERCVGLGSTSCTNATAFIQTEALKWSLTLPSSGITVNASTTCGGVAGFSQVSLTYTFQSIMPQFLNLTSTGTTLTASSCFPTA